MGNKKLAETGLAITFGLLALGLFFKKILLIQIAFAITVIFLFIPFLAQKIDEGWMKLAHFLGNFNGKILLGLIFYIFLTPIAAVFRIFHKDILHLEAHKTDTTFVDINKEYKPEDFEDMW